jgi:hypothetical protein
VSKGSKFLLVVISIAAVVVLFVVRDRNQRRSPSAATLTLYGLTPADLLRECGTPDRDETGRLAPGDGVRDIRYTDSSGRRLVFRFLGDSGADSGWWALGVWTNVTDPDGLGDTVEDDDAIRQLPCLARTAAADRASETLQSALPAPASHHDDVHPTLAAAFLLPLQYAHPEPVPPPPVPIAGPLISPTIPPFPTLPTLPTSPTLRTLPASPKPSGLGPEDPPPPDGPPPEPPPSPKPHVVLVPCVGFTDKTRSACELIDSAILVKDLNETLQAPNPMGRIDELVTKLTGHDFRVIQLPSLLADRDEVIKSIFQLEIQTVNLVTAQLRHDQAKLIPFKWDTRAEKARKLEIMRNDEKQTVEIWRQAVDQSRPSHSMSSSDENDAQTTAGSSSAGSDTNSHNRIHMNDNSAFRQAVEIHNNGWKGF